MNFAPHLHNCFFGKIKQLLSGLKLDTVVLSEAAENGFEKEVTLNFELLAHGS